MRLLSLAMMVLSLVSGVSVATDREQWVQWRGNARNCEVSRPVEWPSSLKPETLKELYRVPLGPSYSGPIVAADRVFVTETVDKKKEVTRALERDTGKELWQVEWEGAMSVPFFAASNGSWIRATPVYDGKRLYVPGMLDVLVTLDAATGKELWRADFREMFSTVGQTFGFVCSPLVDEGFVYVQTSGGLVKLNCETGELAWRGLKEQGGMMGGAFSSPVLATLAGVRQIVVQTRAKLCGVDLATGADLWSVAIPSFRDMNILTPTIIGDRIFTSCYGGGALMYEVTKGESGLQIAEVWKNKTEAYMSSPVVIDGRIYLHLRNQRFCCLDPANGESLWRTTPFGKYWSMAVNGKRVLALDEAGDLILFEADPAEYKEIDKVHVTDATAWAHIAIADGQVFVRALDSLIVYRWQ
ncbi:MAG: outer membrane protein assembly factor BamB precursor [Planctomycetota bacterium]|jgi:outer membrane protein assembly factor BamB